MNKEMATEAKWVSAWGPAPSSGCFPRWCQSPAKIARPAGGKVYKYRLRNVLRVCRIGVMTPIMAGRTRSETVT
jgi:hypothetical protein